MLISRGKIFKTNRRRPRVINDFGNDVGFKHSLGPVPWLSIPIPFSCSRLRTWFELSVRGLYYLCTRYFSHTEQSEDAELASDIEFESEWEATSDWNGDDAKAVIDRVEDEAGRRRRRKGGRGRGWRDLS